MSKIHERRYLTKELRAKRSEPGESSAGTIVGYAAKFNVISELLYDEEKGIEFREVLLPGCFDLEASPDIVCNREHCDDDPLGRTTSGTLTVTVDETGLRFECLAPNTQLGRDTIELITPRGGMEFGDLNACSFAMSVEEDEWSETEDGTPLRSIKRCPVYDVSLVMHPAYPNTEVAMRSLAKARAAKPQEPLFRNIDRARLALAEREI